MKTSEKFRAAIVKEPYGERLTVAAMLIMDQLDELLAEFRPKPPTPEEKKKK